MDFSVGDKASSVKFCVMVYVRPGHGISHFGELCSPRSPKPTNRRAAASIADRRQSASVEGTGVYRQYLPSAYVDIRPSPRRWAYLFVILCVCTVANFSAEDKASGVKFCTAVYRHPGYGISHFGERCSPEAQNSLQA